MSTQPPSDPDIMYDIAPRPSGGWLLTEKKTPGQPRLTATARGEHSKIIPFELHRPQLVPPQTMKDIGYHSLDDNLPVYAYARAGKIERELLEAQTFSPAMMRSFGLWEKLVELQALIVQPRMAAHLASLETTQNLKRCGTVYSITWSVEPNSKDESIRPGVIAKKRDADVMRMVELVTEIAWVLVRRAEGAWTEEHYRQWVKEASLTCGGGGNMSVTSIQVNLTALKKPGDEGEEEERDEHGRTMASTADADQIHDSHEPDTEDQAKTPESIMQQTLKAKSHVHKDSHDERRNFSTILFLNHVPSTHFVGRFNITNFRLSATCIPYSALVFSANNPHGGSGFAPYEEDLPLDSPLRFTPPSGVEYPVLSEDTPFTRCLTIAYSRQDCMRARTRQLNPVIWGEKGLGAFITKRAQANWAIRHAIRDGVDIGVDNPGVDDYLEKFSWVEDGRKCVEERKLVEDALALKGSDDREWELMLKLTGYNSAHIKHDHPSRYESPKQRKARLAREALGDGAYCTAMTSNGARCRAFLGKDVGDVKMCANHYRSFVARQEETAVSDIGEGAGEGDGSGRRQRLKREREVDSDEEEGKHDADGSEGQRQKRRRDEDSDGDEDYDGGGYSKAKAGRRKQPKRG